VLSYSIWGSAYSLLFLSVFRLDCNRKKCKLIVIVQVVVVAFYISKTCNNSVNIFFVPCWQKNKVHKVLKKHVNSLSAMPNYNFQIFLNYLQILKKHIFPKWILKPLKLELDLVHKETQQVLRKAHKTFISKLTLKAINITKQTTN